MLTQQIESAWLIGQVASLSGVPVKTIRFYEEMGLISASGRTEGRFRLFGPEIFNRLAFIKRAQTLGMSLQEISQVLQIHDQGHLPCSAIKDKIEDKIRDIDQQIEQLRILKQQLQGLLTKWNDSPSTDEQTICPNIEHT